MNRQNKWLLCSFIAGTAIAIMAFRGNPGNTGDNRQAADTIPSKSREATRAGERDLDKEIRELEKARIELKDLDLKKIQADINLSLKEIDLENLKLDIKTHLKDVDLEKIQRDVEASIAKIDFDKIEKEIEEAMDKVEIRVNKEEMEDLKKELKKAKVEIKNELNNADFKKEMEELKKIDMKAIEKDLEKAKQEIEKAKIDVDVDLSDLKIDMEKVRKDIEAARIELKGYQEMIYAMEEEGLLNTKEDYEIRYNEGELSINGTKQPDSVVSKYKKYFKNNIRLEKKDGKMEINHLNKSGKKEWSI